MALFNLRKQQTSLDLFTGLLALNYIFKYAIHIKHLYLANVAVLYVDDDYYKA